MDGIWTSLVGLLGVIAGVLLNEVVRRGRRVEAFAPTIFEKRLARYEKLMGLLQAANEVASDVMEKPKYSPEERHALVSDAIMKNCIFR